MYSLLLRLSGFKARKSTTSFFMSVRPSDRIEQLGSIWTDFFKMKFGHKIRHPRCIYN